jgi:hypothetical protein
MRCFSDKSLGMASRAGDLAVDGVPEVISSSSEIDDGDPEIFSGKRRSTSSTWASSSGMYSLGETGILARRSGNVNS